MKPSTPPLLEAVGEPVPARERLRRRRLLADHGRADRRRPPASASAARERDGGDRVRAHRVPGQHAACASPRRGDHRLEVVGELRVDVTRPALGAGSRLAVAARVVGDDAGGRAGEQAGAVDDVAARRGQAVDQDDRRRPVALSPGLVGPGERDADALDGSRRPARAHGAGLAAERVGEVVDVLVGEAERRRVPVADDPLGVDDEDRAADLPRPQHAVGAARPACRDRRAAARSARALGEPLVRGDGLRGDPEHGRVERRRAGLAASR